MSAAPKTSIPQRPLRSWMFVPGNRARFLEKIYELEVPPDGVFFDLEDGVLPMEKGIAREMVAEVLHQERPGPMRTVRINAVSTEWFAQDLDAIVGGGLEGVCVPKVEAPSDLLSVIEPLDRADPDGRIRVIPAIESAAGLLRAPAIAAAHPRVVAIMFGAEDYALDVGLSTKREKEAAELIYARSALVVAATAARVISIDGVFPNLEDPEGLLRDVVQSRRLGFTAKSTFNPRQIGLINEIFSPTPDELAYARRVAEAFEEATTSGDASVAVGGQLVDLPIVQRAQALLAMAEDRRFPLPAE